MNKIKNSTIAPDSVITKAEALLQSTETNDLSYKDAYQDLLSAYKRLHRKLHRVISLSDKYQQQVKEKERQRENIQSQLNQFKYIFLPVCLYCKKTRTDEQYWERIEVFFSRNRDLMFSHGICLDCMQTLFGEDEQRLAKLRQTAGHRERSETRKNKIVLPEEDHVLASLRSYLQEPSLRDHPLYSALQKFADQYGKLLRRMNKILVISDTYQAQLQDLKLRLETLARTDMLTGLINRWDMTEKLLREQSRAERYGRTFSLILVDIDHFKVINDRYGHTMGDRCLVRVARALKTNLRREDLCSRWGGEEFLIMLPETPLQKAVVTAHKLVRVIASLGQGEQQDLPEPVTISAGVSAYRHDNNIETCIRRADEAMYAAKAAGRNTVSFMP